MFSFSKKTNSPGSTDKVWKTRLACWKGTATEALKALTVSQTPVVFTFFRESQQGFVGFLDSNKVPHVVVNSGNSGDEQKNATLLIVDVSSMELSWLKDFLMKRSRISRLCVLFLGHYPLVKPENKILEELRGCIGAAPVVFCLSLEDALLETFGSDRIKPLMETLGMGDDECIEHAMVTKSILRVREKLENSGKAEIKTDSEVDWFARNSR